MTTHRPFAAVLLATLTTTATVACGPASPGEDVGTGSEALSSGEYESTAHDFADAPYIGDWEHNWGYVLGYLLPGSRISAQVVTQDSVYGLIEDSHYGAWDHGHHCGWVGLGGLKGSGSHASAANVCPPPDNDFSLAHGQPSGLFRPGTVVESNGEVQSAVVLPSCPDFNVYANYDPSTRTFHDPEGVEKPGQGTMPSPSDPSCAHYAGVAQQAVTSGYCGFGTRFVTADGAAVEIKDSLVAPTHFGFMHVECIAGSQVGNPSPPPASCGALRAGDMLAHGASLKSCGGAYEFVVQSTDGNLVEYEGSSPLWASNTEGHAGDYLSMQSDGNLVLYTAARTALWSTGTNGHPGAYFAVQDDGNIVVYDGTKPLWARFGL
ncbi:MAG TPA: hypothetical protein VGG39_21750 [Polyangiaceae bacterium]|jgi:hypothetical protein